MEQFSRTPTELEPRPDMDGVLARVATTGLNISPAMARARERRDREVGRFHTAEAELIRLWDFEWSNALERMYSVVDGTKVSLATVNLAYHKVAKDKRRGNTE